MAAEMSEQPGGWGAPPSDSELSRAWEDVQAKLLFPTEARHPYYICAPPWSYASAGVRALYLLCHALNRTGHAAFIVHTPFSWRFRHPWTNHDLKAPMLEEWQAEEHLSRGLCPIVLYPEVVEGNPLDASVVVRWILNFPGLLGGHTQYEATEVCFGYSRELAAAAGAPDQVLHLPTVDTRIFHPPLGPVERAGSCFFASKYTHVHGGTLLPITDGSFEITRWREDSLTPGQIADLFRRCEVFYAYENTALATEAVLCGCPAVFLPNPFLTEQIGREELGTDGFAWGADASEVARARATVDRGAINYLRTYEAFWDQLDAFITLTQARARGVPYREMVTMTSWAFPPPKGISGHVLKVSMELRRWKQKLMTLRRPR